MPGIAPARNNTSARTHISPCDEYFKTNTEKKHQYYTHTNSNSFTFGTLQFKGTVKLVQIHRLGAYFIFSTNLLEDIAQAVARPVR